MCSLPKSSEYPFLTTYAISSLGMLGARRWCIRAQGGSRGRAECKILGRGLQEQQDARQGSCTGLNGEKGFASWGVTRAKHLNWDDYTQVSHTLRVRNNRYGSTDMPGLCYFSIRNIHQRWPAAAQCMGALCSLGKSYILWYPKQTPFANL